MNLNVNFDPKTVELPYDSTWARFSKMLHSDIKVMQIALSLLQTALVYKSWFFYKSWFWKERTVCFTK